MRNKIRSNANILCGLITAGCLAVLSFPAGAANDAMLQLIELMHKKGSITDEEYGLLKNAAIADGEHATAAEDKIKTLPRVDMNGKVKIESADGDFEWQPIGRVMADYSWISSDQYKLGSGAEFRRARLGMEGRMYRYWIYKLEFDFADGSAAMKDAYVGYQDGDNWIKVGQQFVPFGFATMSSSKYMLFTERPLGSDTVLAPSRQIGISGFYTGNDNRWTIHTGIYAGPSSDNPDGCLAFGSDSNKECDEQTSVAARGTFLPWIQDKTHLVNVGGAAWYMKPQDSALSVSQRPYFHSVDTKFVSASFGNDGAGASTGFGADDVLAFNAEGLAIYGPFSVGGEYTHWDVGTKNIFGNTGPTPDINFDTYYVEASYFLTGESMNYNTKKAQYDKITPRGIFGKGGIGAWQAAVRYDVIDLNDPDMLLNGGELGGEMRALGLGLNWYANTNVRFMADFYKILETRDSPASGVVNGTEPYGVTVRGQVFW